MKSFFYTFILVLLLQTTVGLLAHCSSVMDEESQGQAMHHAMQIGASDVENQNAKGNAQHDCCDQSNELSDFSQSCDCDTGLVSILATQTAKHSDQLAKLYFGQIKRSNIGQLAFRLLRPPITP